MAEPFTETPRRRATTSTSPRATRNTQVGRHRRDARLAALGGRAGDAPRAIRSQIPGWFQRLCGNDSSQSHFSATLVTVLAPPSPDVGTPLIEQVVASMAWRRTQPNADVVEYANEEDEGGAESKLLWLGGRAGLVPSTLRQSVQGGAESPSALTVQRWWPTISTVIDAVYRIVTTKVGASFNGPVGDPVAFRSTTCSPGGPSRPRATTSRHPQLR